MKKNSGFLQITSGCSHKKCTFCGYFKDCGFKLSPMNEIEEDIKEILPSFFLEIPAINIPPLGVVGKLKVNSDRGK